jgi:WD40 repeat protein
VWSWNIENDDSKAICDLIMTGHTGDIFCCATLQDGRVVTGAYDNTIRIWSIKGEIWNCDLVIEGIQPNQQALSLAIFQHDEVRFACGCADGKIRVYSSAVVGVGVGDGGGPSNIYEGHKSGVRTLCCYKSDTKNLLASGSYDTDIRVWNVVTNACEYLLQGHTKFVNSVSWLPNGTLVSASDDKKLRLWTLLPNDGGNTSVVLGGHTTKVLCCCALPDGRIASGSAFGKIRIWSLEKDDEEATCDCVLEMHTDSVTVIHALKDGFLVSGSEDCTLRVFSIASSGEARR